MALTANLAALRNEQNSVQTARGLIVAQQQIARNAARAQRPILEAIEQDLRDANANGLGNTFDQGFLDAVPGGTIQTFERIDQSGQNMLSFKYDKDNDRIFDITYEPAPDVDSGTL